MRKSLIILLVTLVSLMGGCNFFRSPGKETCEKIISRQKMTQILTDVYLLEGYLIDVQITRPKVRDSAAWYYSQIFQKHDITYEVFDQALSCYLLHADEIALIHEEILNDLSIRMTEAHNEATPQFPEILEEPIFPSDTIKENPAEETDPENP
jgi:hypothetical protein